MEMVRVIRFGHGMITLFFLSCIGYLYFCDITNQVSFWTYLVAASLLAEGLVVSLNHGECPLGAVHRKYGDQKTFFELLMPKAMAKRAVPFFGVITGIGMLALILR
jgi:hypothetical protein